MGYDADFTSFPLVRRSSNQVIHATALVQRAEKEAAFCGAAVETLGREVEKMEEALERAQIKAQAASASYIRCTLDGIISLCLHPSCRLHARVHCWANMLNVRGPRLQVDALVLASQLRFPQITLQS